MSLLRPLNLHPTRQRRRAIRASWAAAALLAILAAGFFIPGSRGFVTRAFTAQSSAPAAPPNPLLFGTNLALFTPDDQFLTDARTRSLLMQIHVQFIRMPYRTDLPEDIEVAAMQLVKQMGVTPSIVIAGPTHPNLQLDVHELQVIQSVFGHSPVYIDFGNEDDVTPEQYTAAWNQIVPSLKALAPEYQFGGPAAIVYDPAKAAYLLKNGNPRPDYIVWHEYTCDANDSQERCLSALQRWPVHIQLTRQALIAADAQRGATVPLVVDEWNYAPNPRPMDGKSNDPRFMREWTVKAIQTLADGGIFASAQYVATNHEDFELVSPSRLLTPQAQAFSDMYERLIDGCSACGAP